MTSIDLLNPLLVPIIGVALAAAYLAGKSSVSTRRILAVLIGTFTGYGVGVSINALFLSIMSWHPVASGARLDTGDIMTGLMIAGGGVGLLISLSIRAREDAPSEPGVVRRVPDREEQLTP